MMNRKTTGAILLLFMIVSTICHTSSVTHATSREASWHRAVIRVDDAEIPFYLHLPKPEQPGQAILRSGGEDWPVEHSWQGDRLTLTFPGQDSVIHASVGRRGVLTGRWIRSGDEHTQEFRFRAEPRSDTDPIALFDWRKNYCLHEVDRRTASWRIESASLGSATLILTSTHVGDTGDRHGGLVAHQAILSTSSGDVFQLSGARSGGLYRGRYHIDSRYALFNGTECMLLTLRDDDGQYGKLKGELVGVDQRRESLTATILPRETKQETPDVPPATHDPEQINAMTDQPTSEPTTSTPDPAAFLPPSGWFTVELLREDGAAIPFTLFVPNQAIVHDAAPVIRAGGKPVLLVGRSSAGAVSITFPHYDAELRLSASTDDAGLLTGEYRRTGADGSRLSMPARATRVQRLTPDIMIPLDSTAAMPSDAAPVSERAETWRFDFEKGGPARGLFTIARYEPENADPIHTVRGTIMTPTGDYRFLSGDIDMQSDPPRFSLSTFDGAHAFHFQARMDSDLAHMEGRFFSGPTYSDSFTATRLPDGEDVELPDPFTEVSLRPGVSRLRLPQLEDPKYAGKAVIVNIMGTWCPNCHDEAPVLADLHRRYNDQGLEILSLAYEFGLDREGGEERALRQIERFRERHRTTWEIALAGSSDKQQAAATLPALSAVKAYPTTIFLDRDHTVRAIHSGFAGPATGERHEEVKREFERLAREIVEGTKR
ncbi:MAG: TlpA family protein disulfide reductase [Phycisphaeraceae bacterium]|nr:MAG: TlpA family protein disulfide reductase [Phycisphaeraceae bacterium]